jgi:glycosyltransferase involved in cell wall biosynthesis
LQKAITGWKDALGATGAAVELLRESSQLETGAVAHFHGLWQPQHAVWSALCRKKKIPYLVSPHGMLEPWAWRHKWWKKWPYYFLREHAHLAGAAALLATSLPEQQTLRERLPEQRVEMIPLGISETPEPDYHRAREKLGWKEDDWVLLFLSRIDPKKGLPLLFEALASIPKSWPSRLRVVVAGGGEPRYTTQLEGLARKVGAPVEWVGPLDDAAKWPWLQGADLFCLPSHSENFGYAVLESCLVGTPVLTTTATPWQQLPQISGGWLVEPDAAALAGALQQIFSRKRVDAASRRALADWARQNFLWPNLIKGYTRLYDTVLKTR